MPKTDAVAQTVEQLYESGDLRLMQERNDFLLPQILDFVDTRKWLNLRPEYQRRLVWDKRKKSLFIESLLMNVPIPPVFLYEYDLSRYEVMDGQQRLNAIMEFYKNELVLTGLKTWSDLNGRKRAECPPIIRRGLDRRRISATVLIAETKVGGNTLFDVRREVFERLNTGGQHLNAQEIRNALYPGRFNQLLISLASSRDFRALWQIPLKGKSLTDNNLYRRMGDCELVLRFFAFRRVARIKGSVRSMLDSCMKESASISASEARQLGPTFRTRLALARDVFGANAFQLEDSDGRRKPSAPLYDAIMVALDRQWDHRTALRENRARIATALRHELARAKVYELIVGRANTANAVRGRIRVLERVMKRSIE